MNSPYGLPADCHLRSDDFLCALSPESLAELAHQHLRAAERGERTGEHERDAHQASGSRYPSAARRPASSRVAAASSSTGGRAAGGTTSSA